VRQRLGFAALKLYHSAEKSLKERGEEVLELSDFKGSMRKKTSTGIQKMITPIEKQKHWIRREREKVNEAGAGTCWSKGIFGESDA